ncbi:MAG: TRAP transporter substrate-binding protein [Bacteroidota bacterium]
MIAMLCLSGFLISCQTKTANKTIKLAHGLPTTHPVHLAIEHMAAQLEAISLGAMRMEVYPSEQLGTERQCLELLQLGAVGMTKVSASVMENFSPKMKALSLPYIFRDTAHFHRTLDGPVGEQLLAASSKYLLKGMAFYDAGSRSFYGDKPIMHPDDLDGLKIRVQESQTAIDLVNNLGGKATPISWGELYSALQQGTVDGAENNPPSLYQSRHYEVCKHYSLNEHTMVPDVLVMSLKVWNKLSDQEQNWVQAAVRSSVQFQRMAWQKSEAETLIALEEGGVSIYRPDKTPFSTKVEPMYAAYQQDEEMYRLIQAIRNQP